MTVHLIDFRSDFHDILLRFILFVSSYLYVELSNCPLSFFFFFLFITMKFERSGIARLVCCKCDISPLQNGRVRNGRRHTFVVLI